MTQRFEINKISREKWTTILLAVGRFLLTTGSVRLSARSIKFAVRDAVTNQEAKYQ